jgi:hypothetical protein
MQHNTPCSSRRGYDTLPAALVAVAAVAYAVFGLPRTARHAVVHVATALFAVLTQATAAEQLHTLRATLQSPLALRNNVFWLQA